MTEEGLGEIDLQALKTIHDIFKNQEPLTEETKFEGPTGSLPRSLVIEMSEGIQSKGKFEIRWDEQNFYNIQYIENEDLKFRFDNHPNLHSSRKHYHPPPKSDRDKPEKSCIKVEKPTLVTRAIIKIWRE